MRFREWDIPRWSIEDIKCGRRMVPVAQYNHVSRQRPPSHDTEAAHARADVSIVVNVAPLDHWTRHGSKTLLKCIRLHGLPIAVSCAVVVIAWAAFASSISREVCWRSSQMSCRAGRAGWGISYRGYPRRLVETQAVHLSTVTRSHLQLPLDSMEGVFRGVA